MKNPSSPKILLTLLIFSHTGATFAGSPSRPYLVWANLSEKNRPNITFIIRSYVDSLPGDEFCNDSAFGWIVYTKSRPAGIQNDLIREALDHHNSTTKRSIANKLRSFRAAPEVNDGLDGVIAYSEIAQPHMASIDARGRIRESMTIQNINDSKQIIDAFCSVIPEIYRR